MSIPTEVPTSSEQVAQTQAVPQSQPQSQPTKRSSRRANTAERRATHNAVERLRRETLNGRFLDLAAMLPALAAQRRPSKSAIVNQSIALLTSQRRGRIVAARELRLIKTENDALRQELNEWRARNSLPRVEEPPRSGDLIALLAVEEEAEGDEEMMNMMINSRRAAFEMGGDDDDYNDDGDEEQLQQQQQQQLSPSSAHPYGAGATMTIPSVHHKVLPQVHHQQQQQQQQQAIHYAAAQQQQQAVFEQQKAAMARAQMAAHRASYPPAQPQQQQQLYSDNFFAADMYEYPSANWTQKAASTLATPPGTAHGHKEPSPYATTANSAFLAYGAHNPTSLGAMFKTVSNGGRARSEDGDSVGESTGSSHFSSVSDLGGAAAGMNLSSSPVDHTFAFNMGMMGGALQMPPAHMGVNMMPMGMSGMLGMAPPSPPHSVSPSGSQPQSRRPSVNIPGTYAGNGSKHASPSHSPGPTPTPSQAHFAGMGLMM